MSITRKRLFFVTIFCLITVLYLFVILLTFKSRTGTYSVGDVAAFSLTLLGGVAVFGLGYFLTLGFGGKASLKIVDATSRFNGSKHVINVKETQTHKTNMDYAPLLYTPTLVFLIALAISVNIHYLDSSFSVSLQTINVPSIQAILGFLDIFSKPTAVGSLRYSIDILPIMVFFITLGGIIPSMIFPYLSRFKINSYNGAPFHKGILFNAIGTILGVTVILSIVNIFYGILIGTQPHYYSYLLPTLIGFSLHYFLGVYSASFKAENYIENQLRKEDFERVFRGTITIQKEGKSD